METIYERAKETAAKIRAALKTAFPGIKFSVRADEFSMGSSVDVRWTDGPRSEEVDSAVLSKFQSTTFDGMTDSTDYHGYIGSDGKRYSGAKFVSGRRDLSPGREAAIKAWAEKNHEGAGGPDWSVMNQSEKAMIAAGLL